MTDDKRAALAIPAAKAKYAMHGADDNLEVDDDARTSVADNGVWVQAWVWISNDELEEA